MDQSKAARKKRARRMQRIEMAPGRPDPKDLKKHQAIFLSKDVWLVPARQWCKQPA